MYLQLLMQEFIIKFWNMSLQPNVQYRHYDVDHSNVCNCRHRQNQNNGICHYCSDRLILDSSANFPIHLFGLSFLYFFYQMVCEYQQFYWLSPLDRKVICGVQKKLDIGQMMFFYKSQSVSQSVNQLSRQVSSSIVSVL